MSWTKNTLILSGAIIGGSLIFSQNNKPIYVELDSVADQLVDAGFESKSYKVLPDELRTIVVTTDINAQSSKRIIEQLLYLNHLDSTKPIKLILRTEGGWEADAFSIIDIMRSIEAPVDVHAVGDVYSSGLMILAAASGKRLLYENTLIGFHALEDEPEIFVKRYNDFWSEFSSLPSSLTSLRNGEMKYLSHEQVLKYNLADSIKEKVKN